MNKLRGFKRMQLVGILALLLGVVGSVDHASWWPPMVLAGILCYAIGRIGHWMSKP